MNNNKNKSYLVYIIPNLFTASSAFVGMLSIIASSKGLYEKAVYFIILSLLLDGLDGRIARIAKATSKFGAEFDSLADLVAFGVAPAMLFYYYIGMHFGKIGSLLTALYVLFGALRLARFNVTAPKNEPSVFIGVPIPTAAIFISIWILFSIKHHIMTDGFYWIIMMLMAFISILMVSNIRFPSFKKINFKRENFKKVLILLIVVFSIAYLYFIEFLAFFFTFYILYGVIRGFKNYFKRKKIAKKDKF